MLEEKNTEAHFRHVDEGNAVSATDADSHITATMEGQQESRNSLEHDAPMVYWKSFRFLGSMLAIMLMANSLFIGYSMPVNVLSVIDADIGMT